MSTSLSAEFIRCAAWLEAALERSREGLTLYDVAKRIATGEAQFWPCKKSAFVTSIRQEPKRRVCVVWLAGGDLEELQFWEPRLCEWARENGCSVVEIIGRTGWKRALEGYDMTAVVLTKEI